ncbi:monocarboxylate transporter 1-like isoform X2 [Mercenaria mercenaria]|uniref:monocarboxylate transporter 1-like isoform X2 n=1 Tax=Mercenaria mercenaria TaxID=6596 RepID=UPI00234F37D1|nr:monocarboxylate transporter 1-like isoform X2 [Mercenaria mercenaria]
MKNKKTYERSDIDTKNDSCHRWLIFITASLSMMLDIGFMFSFGTLYVNIMTTFHVGRSEAAMVQSILMAVRFGTGMISGAVVQRFGTLPAGVFGSCLATSGLVLSYFASSILILDISIGIILAFGSSCLYIASSISIGKHFSGEKRHILMSIQSAAGGLGGMIFPFVLKYLSDHFGLKGTLLIVGGIYLQILPASLLWRDDEFKSRKAVHLTEQNTNDTEVKEKVDANANRALWSCSDASQNERGYGGVTNCTEDDKVVNVRNGGCPKIKHVNIINRHAAEHADFKQSYVKRNDEDTMVTCTIQNTRRESIGESLKHLACNPSFVLFAIGLAVAYPALGILFIFIVDLFLDAGLSEDNATFGLLLVHMFSIFGRLLPGLVLQSKRVPALSVPICASIVTSAAMAGLVAVTDLKQLLLLLGLIGIPYGVFVSVFSVTTLKIVGIDRLSNAIGVHFTLNGIGSAVAGPISGSLRDYTGSYTYPFWVASGVILVGAMMFTCALQIRRKRNRDISEETPLLQN